MKRATKDNVGKDVVVKNGTGYTKLRLGEMHGGYFVCSWGKKKPSKRWYKDAFITPDAGQPQGPGVVDKLGLSTTSGSIHLREGGCWCSVRSA